MPPNANANLNPKIHVLQSIRPGSLACTQLVAAHACICILFFEKDASSNAFTADLLAGSRGPGRSATRPDLEPLGPAWAATHRRPKRSRHGSCMSRRHRPPSFDQLVQGTAPMSRNRGGAWCSSILMVSTTDTMTRQTRAHFDSDSIAVVIAVGCLLMPITHSRPLLVGGSPKSNSGTA